MNIESGIMTAAYRFKEPIKPKCQKNLFSLDNDPKDRKYRLRVRDHYIQELAKNNPTMTLKEIIDLLKDANFDPITRKRIHQIFLEDEINKNNLRLNAIAANRLEKRQEIIDFIQANPKLSRREVAKEFGYSVEQLDSYLKGSEIRPFNRSKKVSDEERDRRERILKEAFGSSYKIYAKRIRTASLEIIFDRIKEIKRLYDYTITHYSVARVSLQTFKDRVELFEKEEIDWRDDSKGYYKLFPNSLEYIKREIAILRSVKANHELDYLITNRLQRIRLVYASKEHQNKIDLMRNYLETKDPEIAKQLFYYFESVAVNSMFHRISENGRDNIVIPYKALFIDIGRTALTEVLSNCEAPEKDLISFMTLITSKIYIDTDKLFFNLITSEDVDKSQFNPEGEREGANLKHYDYQ